MQSASEASTRSHHARRVFLENAFIAAALVVIALAAIYFRFVGQNWDDFTHLHPDERHLTQVAERVGTGGLQPTGPDADAQMRRCLERYPESGGVGPFFDAQCSNWYPRNVGFGIHVYGELPLFVVRIAAEVTREVHVAQIRLNACTALPDSPGFGECFSAAQSDDVSNPLVQQINASLGPEDFSVALNWSGYNGIHLVGRSVSAIAELLSLIFVFLTGRALYNKWVGLLAAAFAAAAVFPIQLSHFWTMDAFTNLPLMIGSYFAVRAMKRGKLLDFALFGVGFGGALASRINTLPLFGVIVLAAMIYAAPAIDRRIARPERMRLVQRGLTGIVLAMFVTLVVFRLTNPHAFVGGPGVAGFFNLIPHRPFLDDMAQAQYLTSGKADFPPNNQWASRTSYLFPARNIVLWGLGLPLGLMAWFGVAWAALQMLRNRPGWTRHALIVAWVLVYFGYMGRQWVMTMRYYMPLYPFLAIMAAWALVELVTRARRGLPVAGYAAREDGAMLPRRTSPGVDSDLGNEAQGSWREVFPESPQRAESAAGWRRWAYAGAVGLLVFTLAFTYVWAAAFTSIYRKQLTRVSASHWILQNVPSALSVRMTPDDGGEARLVNMPFWATGQSANATPYHSGERAIAPFVAPSAQVDRVIVHQLLDTTRQGEAKTFHAAIAADQNGASILATGQIEGDFGSGDAVYGSGHTIALDRPAPLIPGGSYFLVTWSDAPLTVLRLPSQAADFTVADGTNGPTAGVVLPDNPALETGQASTALGAIPTSVQFTAPFAGTFDRIEIAHLRNPLADARDTALNVTLSDGASGDLLARGALRIPAEQANNTARSPLGDPASIVLDNPVRLAADQSLTVALSTADGGPAIISGAVIATEGPWDDAVPAKICALPGGMPWSEDLPPGMADLAACDGVDPWGLYYRGEELYLSAEDDYQKQQIMQTVLDETDYLTISSNRFYDTVTRMPTRYPMSVNYYKALFSGQLGFDLVHQSVSTYQIGGLRIHDQTLPTFNVPAWVNEWESEEAFSVYDHPAVFVFKKDPARYSSATVADVLGAHPLNDSSMVSLRAEDPTLIGIIRWGALETTAAPTGLMMDDTLRDIQTQGGTYSNLFNRDWLVNAQPVLSVAAWWLAMLAFGWAVWPILYFLLPALPDRAYPFAKIAGLLLVSWIAWVGGSLKFLTWSQGGLFLIMLAVAAFSAALVWRRRVEFFAYVRQNIRHLIVIEGITLLLFVAFLLVRLGNPDLWAQTLGGEKPMNFAYFNAVLRSTVFPPYDPWYAGGYMNYYYYGYVLVGAPVKLLGIMPSVAYNLIVPTLFALTGIGAFSLAFNLAAARWFRRDEPGSDAPDAPPAARRCFALRVPGANPYVAGALALLVCVVLGNLGTPAVFLTGVVRAGG
ncbi:MAG: glycosyltransferase family 39 protein, partial [Anaerolineae bacterium]|nr:glycosyltransferase family 39 protein [Anaerolineae bacterium]